MRTQLPAPYQRLLLEIACEQGATPKQVLEGTGLSLDHLNSPDARVDSRQAARMVRNAVRSTGNEGIGLDCGLRAQPTLHGFLGYATMSCANLREALELAIRFIHLRERDVTLSMRIEGGDVVLDTMETHDLGYARRVFYEGLLVGLARAGGAMIGNPFLNCELWFDWPEPAYYAAYRRKLPPIRFSMSSVQLRMPARELERRLVMADPAAAQQAIAQIEREQALVGREPDRVIQRVRAQLSPAKAGYPNLKTIASRLFMSARTLKRKLQASGCSFQQLLDQARKSEALRLMGNSDLDLQDIAAALGYRDPPSFTRAFRRWSGQSPSQARAKVEPGLPSKRR